MLLLQILIRQLNAFYITLNILIVIVWSYVGGSVKTPIQIDKFHIQLRQK